MTLSAESLSPEELMTVRLPPNPEKALNVAPSSSSSVAIWVLLRLAVPSRNWSAVNEARPGISAGSESAPDLIHRLQLLVGGLWFSRTRTVKTLGSWDVARWGE